MTREHVIRGLGAAGGDSGRGDLVLDIDGTTHSASLRIDRLAERLVADLPARIVDLLEVAGYIYAADAALRRGGPTARGLGQDWRRRLVFEIPVREPDVWQRADVRKALIKTLDFLSDDFYDFRFVPYSAPPAGERFFRFRKAEGFGANAALLFSGGLDSLAGALDELVARNNRVVLISHYSSTRLQRVQADLVRAMHDRLGANRLYHVPVRMQLRGGSNREPSHRARSFFFAAIGIATASMFGLDRLDFHENGIVSMNLPVAGQVVGAYATRSTHPQALDGFGRLFSALFDRPVRVSNSSFWRTKTDVVAAIRDLDAADLIRHTRSCAEVHGRTTAHPHCGLCSQCIDRRFAVLAAACAEDDPVEAYDVEPLAGSRITAPSREIALGYVRNARRFASMSPGEFVASFGELQRAVAFLGGPPGVAAERLFGLHRRHGQAVSEVMKEAVGKAAASLPGAQLPYAEDSLVMLAGLDIFAPGRTSGNARETPAPQERHVVGRTTWTIRLGPKPKQVTIEGLGELAGASAETVAFLARSFLDASGQGRSPEDYPISHPLDLAESWDIFEPAVRRRVLQLRRRVRHLASDAGIEPPDDDAIIENVQGRGYRLNPDSVKVLVVGG